MRAIVSKRAAAAMLQSGWISPADLLNQSAASVRALDEFCQRREQLKAEGTIFVSYMREAFVSQAAESARVTFDREIAGHPYDPRMGLTVPDDRPGESQRRGIGTEVQRPQAELDARFDYIVRPAAAFIPQVRLRHGRFGV